MPAISLRRCLACTGSIVLAAVFVVIPSNAAVAAPCPGAGLPAGAQPTADAEDAVECEINQQRRSRHLPVLDADRALARAGRRHALDMVRGEYFSHVSPAGQTLEERLRAVGYVPDAAGWAAGEVLAWGTHARSTPAAVVAAWMRSPGHRRVLLKPSYRDVGVGVARGNPDGAAGATYAAELGVAG